MTKREMNPPDLGCKRPSRDWYCSRQPGHEGPCAARRVSCLNVNDGIERGSPWKLVAPEEALANLLMQPPPSETRLKELLDALEFPWNSEQRTAARSSLESLYRDITEENERLRHMATSSTLGEHYAALRKRFDEVDTELSALRSLQLTESEDWQLDQAIEDAEALPRPDVQIECLRGLLQKLRISSKATAEEL